MRLYEGTITDFNQAVLHNAIADQIATKYEQYYKRAANQSEFRAWQQSLLFLKNAFEYSRLQDNGIIIEYELPYSTRRIDTLIFGRDYLKSDSVVLIELKQWSNDNVEDCPTEGNILVDYGRFRKEQAHPSLQVQGYHFDLIDFLSVFGEEPKISLNSCAYCHNYSREGPDPVLFSSKFKTTTDSFPVFAKEDVQNLGAYLRARLSEGNGLDVFGRFVTSPIRPSRKLLEHTSQMINNQQIFNLIDDQIAAYNSIMHKAKHLSQTGRKSAVIVKGGPGTGKSVIALEVMGELMRQDKIVFHATGSSAFTNTLRKIVGPRARRLFSFFNSFATTEANSIEILICDEAHRIRKTSNSRYTLRESRSNDPQIDELFRVAKLNIFFIDENQIVRPTEIGSIALIKEAAARFGIETGDIAEFELKTQFRCSGSDAYLQWLDKVLGITDSENVAFDARMQFKIFSSPSQMVDEINKRNAEKKNSARIVAGFCWPWSNSKTDGGLVKDVQIGEFAMPWERKDAFWKWATDDSGMDQVGTVYTAQGFEYDYIGVIFGNDLTYDPTTNQWISNPQNSHDTQVKRNNPELTRHLQHVYRVLMSRAHRGVYVNFMDGETERHFRNALPELEVASPLAPRLQ
ncbi:MAG: DUF2075 domain-containing protein [Acidobacteriia bacterium]|nr:DUF2075 domain-containing protein [Terriglobia bacterium]